MNNGSLTAPDPTRVKEPIRQSTFVKGAIVVHTKAPPPERFRRGRPGKWKDVYATIMGMDKGQWFEVPTSREMDEKKRQLCLCAIRKWIVAKSSGASAYINERGGVTVRM